MGPDGVPTHQEQPITWNLPRKPSVTFQSRYHLARTCQRQSSVTARPLAILCVSSISCHWSIRFLCPWCVGQVLVVCLLDWAARCNRNQRSTEPCVAEFFFSCLLSIWTSQAERFCGTTHDALKSEPLSPACVSCLLQRNVKLYTSTDMYVRFISHPSDDKWPWGMFKRQDRACYEGFATRIAVFENVLKHIT